MTIIDDTSPLSPSILGNLDICEGENTTLTADAGYDTYQWSTGESTSEIVVALGGVYSVTVTQGVTCTGSATVTVNETALPIIDLSGNQDLCENETTTLTVNTTGAVTWYDAAGTEISNDNPIVIDPLTLGEAFTVEVTEGGCSATLPVNLNVAELPIITTSGDFTICSGESVDISASASDGTISWSGEGIDNPSSETQTVTPSGATVYTITATNGACTVSETLMVNVSNPFSVDLTADPGTDIVAGESITLTALLSGLDLDDATFVWTADNSEAPSGNDVVTVTPLQSTTYTVEVTSPDGCTILATIFINVEDLEIEIPNAFSPNGDDTNDTFYPVFNDLSTTIIEFKMFDRWGELVYDNPGAPWDGTVNGKEMPQDIYVYFVRFQMPDGTERFEKGDVALLR